MATFFGLSSSPGFLWLQLTIFIWQAVRPAATLRVPWALISTAFYKIFVRKKFNNDHFILLSTDYNDTADAEKFCEENRCDEFEENELSDESEENKPSVRFTYKRTDYICESDKANQVRLLITAELNNLAIVKESKIVNGFMRVWTLCSADEAIRMCLQSKRFRLSFRKRVTFCLIEHMPLITHTYWLTKVLGGIPLYLTAKGNEQLSSILTLSLIILDFTYNIWVPLVEQAYIMFVRIIQLILSYILSAALRFLIFYLLSNFDNIYLPCSIIDLKVKIKKADVFYTTDNTVMNCGVKSVRPERFEVDACQDVFDFRTSTLTLHIEKKGETTDLVKFELKLLGVLYDLVRAEYSMSSKDFITYIGCLQLLQEDKIGLVQSLDDGFLRKIQLFGFEETINLFWGGNVKVYRVEVNEERLSLIT